MSQHPRTRPAAWTGTDSCPFCSGEIADPGAGFMAHIDDTPACRQAFDGWRERVREDLRGEWTR